MRIAQFYYDIGNYTVVHPESHEKVLSEAVRISEYTEVQFTPRDPAAVEADRKRLYAAKRERLHAQLAKLEEA